jgi:hypothetical protein
MKSLVIPVVTGAAGIATNDTEFNVLYIDDSGLL